MARTSVRSSGQTSPSSFRQNSAVPSPGEPPERSLVSLYGEKPSAAHGSTKPNLAERFKLRAALRAFTTIKAICGCGKYRRRRDMPVGICFKPGRASFTNLQRCGSVWACPVCTSTDRWFKALERVKAIEAHLEQGGAVLTCALTLRHRHVDNLKELLVALTAGWTAVTGCGYGWRQTKQTYGIVGFEWVAQTTYGRNGWHPHRHITLFLERDLSPEQLKALAAWIFEQWRKGLKSVGRRSNLPARLEAVRKPRSYAEYLSALWNRDDGKGRTPFELLDDHVQTGDMADLVLWHEYERATKGERSGQWSPGLKKRLGLPEKQPAPDASDREKLSLPEEVRILLQAHPEHEAALLQTARLGGKGAVISYLDMLVGQADLAISRPFDSGRREQNEAPPLRTTNDVGWHYTRDRLTLDARRGDIPRVKADGLHGRLLCWDDFEAGNQQLPRRSEIRPRGSPTRAPPDERRSPTWD